MKSVKSMVSKIIVKPFAEIDIDEIVKWYELESEHLGKKFFFELKAVPSNGFRYSFGFSKRYREIRAFSLKNFPYNVYYIWENNVVYVVAVVHKKGTR